MYVLARACVTNNSFSEVFTRDIVKKFSRRFLFLLYIFIFSGFLFSHSAFAVDKIFWSDTVNKNISRANLDGSSPEDVCTSADGVVTGPNALAVDTAGGNLFWLESGGVYKSGLAPPCSRTLAFAVANISASGLEFDPVNSKLYWFNTSKQLQRANIDGTSLETFTNFTPTGTPNQIALDPIVGKIYFVERVVSNYFIQSANMDMTGGSTTVYDNATGTINGLEVRPNIGILYFTDQSFSIVRRVNTDGTGVSDVLISPDVDQPFGIAIDERNNNLYVANFGGDQLTSAGFDGSLPTTILNPTGTSIWDVELALADDTNIAFHPSANGTTNNFSTPNCGGVANWQCVNDQAGDATEGPVDLNDAGTTIDSTAAGREMFNLVDNPSSLPTGTTITGIEVFARVGRAAAGAAPSLQLSYDISGTPVDGVSQSGLAKSCCSDLVSQAWTGLAWSITDFNALQVGVVHDGAGTFMLSQMWVTVTYTIPPVGTNSISGRIFNDADFNGTAADYDGGTNDVNLSGVDVELYDNSNVYITSVTSDASGYTIPSLPDGTYKLRARVESISATNIPEMTGAYDSGSSGFVAKYGGADAAISDTATANNAGPGDNYTTITLSGGNVSNANIGFAYNLITNVNDSGQGSLREFLENANAGVLGANNKVSQFRIGVATNQSNATDAWWRINPASAFPLFNVNASGISIDASTQAINSGVDSNTRGPEIELNGTACASCSGFNLSAATNVTIKGFAINQFPVYGISIPISATGTIVRGNYVGTDAIGSNDMGNASYGVSISANNVTIGGTSAGDRNVLSGNNNWQLRVGSVTNLLVQGNYIGTNYLGNAVLTNDVLVTGIFLSGSNATIGGSAAGAGNIIAGNDNGIGTNGAVTNLTVQGNIFGTDSTGTISMPNRRDISLSTSAATSNIKIGGVLPGEGNVLANAGFDYGILLDIVNGTNEFSGNTVRNTTRTGIYVLNGTNLVVQKNTVYNTGSSAGDDGATLFQGTGTKFYHNTFYNNFERGLDIATGAASVVAQNNIFVNETLHGINDPNNRLVTLSNNAYFNNGTACAGTLCASETGTVTSDPLFVNVASGDFSLTECTSPAVEAGLDLGGSQPDMNGASAGNFTGTAPDMGAIESSCGIVYSNISGRVFDDANFTGTTSAYDGGASDLNLAGVDVELYDNSNVYVSSTATAADGTYSFASLADGTYKVRVRSATINVSALPEMTWANGSALLGGQNKSVDDTSTADNAGIGDTYTTVAISGVDVTNVDFGFAYNLIVSNNDSGQGTLRQFLTNANSGATTSKSSVFDTSVFIPATPAQITLLSNLPTMTSGSITIDASNAGVVIDGNAKTYHCVWIASSNNTVKGLTIQNCTQWGVQVQSGTGNTIGGDNTVGSVIANVNNGEGNIIINNGTISSYGGIKLTSNDNFVYGNLVGTDGTTAQGNTGYGIYVLGDGNTIGGTTAAQRNVSSGNVYGIYFVSANNNIVQGNYFGTNIDATAAIPNTTDGVRFAAVSNGNIVGGLVAGSANVIAGNTSRGIYHSTTNPTDTNNVYGNFIGVNEGGTSIPNGNGIYMMNGTLNLGNDAEVQTNIFGPVTSTVLTLTSNATINMAGTFDINGTMTMAGGNLNMGTANITYAGASWNNNSVATVDPGTSSIVFDGTSSQSIKTGSLASWNNIEIKNSGTVTLQDGLAANNFTAQTPNTWINFASGATYTINGAFTINGQASGTPVKLRSTGAQYTLNVTSGPQQVYFASVQDSNAASNDIRAYNSTNVSGNDNLDVSPHWVFTTAIVTTNNNDSGAGSFREALTTATAGDVIIFDTSVFNPSAPATISLASSLPAMSVGDVLIDASNAGVVLDGANFYNCIQISSNNNTVRGLKIQNCIASGVNIISGTGNTIGGDSTVGSVIAGVTHGQGNIVVNNAQNGIRIASNNNFVYGNLLGTTGTAAAPNIIDGVYILGSSNTIGGTSAGYRNVISGNSQSGIYLSAASNNLIQGNYIGTNDTATASIPNAFYGVHIVGASTANTIGGSVVGARNIISGNADDGIHITGAGTNGNIVIGNYIGTDRLGSSVIGNSNGVGLYLGAQSNTIGGTNPGEGNVLSGNSSGVFITSAGTSFNTILGNYIGTDATGMLDLGNTSSGVRLGTSADSNTIGGTTAAARNIISGNNINAIQIATSSNTVQGNYIGVNVTGDAAINNGTGIIIQSPATNTVIGGATAAAGNVIAGNTNHAIMNLSTGTTDIQGNYLGTNSASDALPNGLMGLFSNNGVINLGKTGDAQPNVIAANGDDGIQLQTGTINLGSTVDVNDLMDLQSGTLNLADSTLNLSGDWLNTAATITVGTSTVTLDGTALQTITTAAGNFNNLSVTNASASGVFFADGFSSANFTNTTPGSRMTFAAGGTYTISGTLNLNGQATGTKVVLVSSSPGARYTFDVTGGPQTVNFVDVTDSNASSNNITANDSTGVGQNNDNAETSPFWIFAVPGAAVSGTVTDDTEVQIRSGGSTIVLTLTGDTWVAAGATFDAQRQNIINGIDSAQAEANGWDAIVKTGLALTDVVRTSDTVVTITLPSFTHYNITANETITATIPASALVTSASPLVATPTFSITSSTGSTISGIVFEDANFTGTATDYDSGVNDNALANVVVALYDNANVLQLSTSTLNDGSYAFYDLANATYRVRVISNTIADDVADAGNTPSGGFNACVPATCSYPLAEMTWANGAKLGGLDKNVSDVGSPAPGDTFANVTVAGADIANFNMGFAFNLITNTNDSGQGSARQFILNANAIGPANATTANTAVFDASVFLPAVAKTITPTSPLPDITDDGTTIDGSNNYVLFSGASTGAGVNGFTIKSSNNILKGLGIHSFKGDGIEIFSGSGNVLGGDISQGTSTLKEILYIVFNGDGLANGGDASDDGIEINSDGNFVYATYLGTNGAVSEANTGNGIYIAGNNNTIGSADSNFSPLISGNGASGILIDGGSNNTILGSRIGVNWDMTATAGNTLSGIRISGAASGNTIGGAAAGEGNIIGGNAGNGIHLFTGNTSTNTMIKGNLIGTNSLGVATMGNTQSGIVIDDGSNVTIGGLLAGEGNVIAANGAAGIAVPNGGVVGNVYIYGNYIGTDASASVIPNTSIALNLGTGTIFLGNASEAQSNIIAAGHTKGVQIIDTATVNFGGSLTLKDSFSINTATATANLNNATINLSSDWTYVAGTVNPGTSTVTLDGAALQTVTSGAGSFNNLTVTNASVAGVTFADGFSTANFTNATASSKMTFNAASTYTISGTMNLNGQASVTKIVLVSSLPGTRYTFDVTGGAQSVSYVDVTDSNASTNNITALNSAGVGQNNDDLETSPFWIFATTYSISGRVFEDANFNGTSTQYDGGASDIDLSGVDVELYDNSNVYLTSTTTAVDGTYSFAGLVNGTYKVRVRAATIDVSALPEMTGYKNESGTWTNLYGGQNATTSDTATGDNAGIGDNYGAITVSGANVNNIEFGFAYNLIVNTNDSGQGSLRQVLLNANTTGIVTAAKGNNTSQFRMQVATNQTDGIENWWRIAPTSTLPSLSSNANNFALDASTQRSNSATDSNTIGPEIEINGASCASCDGLTLTTATGITIREFAINAFRDGINIGASASNTTVVGNYIGTNATGVSAVANSSDGIWVQATNAVIGGTTAADRNVISGNTGNGIVTANTTTITNITIQGNYIGVNATNSAGIANAGRGIMLQSAAATSTVVVGGVNTGEGNVIAYNAIGGFYIELGGGTHDISGNTIRNNASHGLYVFAATGLAIQKNIISNNGDAASEFGIVIFGGSAIKLYHNTIYGSFSDGVNINGGSGFSVRNNIFSNNGNNAISDNVPAITTLSNNNYFANAGTCIGGNCGSETNSITSDPLFVNAASDDFSLTECSSAAINAGVDLVSDQPDMNGASAGLFTGSAPDMGAVESTCTSGTVALSGTVTNDSETEIRAGGSTLVLTLSGDTWVAAGATFDAERANIINGLTSAGAETNGWNNIVKAGLLVANVARTSDTVVTVTLPAFAAYDITATETITATVPASALTTSASAVIASPTFNVTPNAATVALSGTVTDDNEDQIRTGGSTIVLTLTDDTWVSAGAAFDAERTNIINGLTSAGAETNGWNNVVKTGLSVTDVVRTSNTVVTITLPAFATYDITAIETITATVPASALTISGSAVVANPTFDVLPVGVTVTLSGTVTDDSETEIRAGGSTIVLTLTDDTWVATGATFDAERANIINGLTSASGETNGWNNIVKTGLLLSNVVRTSNTVVTITLPAFTAYDITSTETITATVPASALTISASAVVASPTFNVTPITATVALSGTVTDDSETEIRAGGSTIILTLSDDTWVAAGATFDAERANIINGLTSAGAETNGWNNIVKAGLLVTNVVRTSDTVVTVTLPAFAAYDITATETITATVPASALTTSASAVVASPTFNVTPIAATVALSGTVTDDSETEIRAGGSTIILTLSDDTWVAAGATFDAERANIINGLTSAGAETNGWNNIVKAGLLVTNVARTSDTVVTVTLPAFAAYDITTTETITATVPASALTTSASAVVASPTFNVTPIAATVALSGTVTDDSETEIRAGGSTIVLTLSDDTWVAAGATFDAERMNIINGLTSAGAEGNGWNNVVKTGLSVTDVVRTSNTVVTITLPAFATYDITATETITVTVPASALTTSASAVVASPTFDVTSVGTTVALSGTVTDDSETEIRVGGSTIVLTLTDDTWVAAGATFDAERANIINGLTSAGAETNGWNNIVKAGLLVTNVVRTSDTVVTITLPAFTAYDITSTETITATVPASALTTSASAVIASPTLNVTPITATVALSGTVTDDSETEIRTGGSTIVLTLTDDTWVATGATFDAERTNIINGLTSAGAETNGWNNIVKAGLLVTNVVRTSDTVVTVTLPAFAAFDINASETITVTVPASALVTTASALIASPTFDVIPTTTTVALSGTVVDDSELDIRNGASTIVLTLSNDTWISAGATFDAERANIINGLTSAGAESNGWNNIVKPGLTPANVVRTSNTVVTITLPAFATYDINVMETITATVPASALSTSAIPVVASPTFDVTPLSASVALSGTVVDDSELDIRNGGSTIVLTLTNDTWLAAGAAFDAERANIINGLTSVGSEANGWNALVKAVLSPVDVVRTSNTVVTITLPPIATYDITNIETITATIPASALSYSSVVVIASPTFDVKPVSGVVVSPISGLLSEAGDTASFSVVLNAIPSADVVIPISSLDTTEGVVDKSSLTFTSTNWNVAQLVTVTGVDDVEIDGDITFIVEVGDPVSGDSAYDVLSNADTADVSVTNRDNDQAIISFESATSNVVDEIASNVSINVRLNLPAGQTTTDMSIEVADAQDGSARSGVDYVALPVTVLTFPAGSVDGATQSITMTTIADTVMEGEETIRLRLQNLSGANAAIGAQDTHQVRITDIANVKTSSSEKSFSAAEPDLVNSDGVAYTIITANILDDNQQPLAGHTILFSSDRNTDDAVDIFETMDSVSNVKLASYKANRRHNLKPNQTTEYRAVSDYDGKVSVKLLSNTPGQTTINIFNETDNYALRSPTYIFFTRGEILKLSGELNPVHALRGDVVNYQYIIRNDTDYFVDPAYMHLTLPLGVKYVPGSLRINGAVANEPVYQNTLKIDLGVVPGNNDLNSNDRADPGESGYVVVTLQAVLGSRVMPGSYDSYAYIVDACDDCVVSNTEKLSLRVDDDALFDLGTIIGKVFNDANKNGLQDEEESGVQGVTLVLDNGSVVVTDKHGRYYINNIKPGPHLLKINNTNLPGNSSLLDLDHKIVNITPGLLATANFPIDEKGDMTTIGSDTIYGLKVSRSTSEKNILIAGNTSSMNLIVDGQNISFPRSRVQLDGDSQSHIDISSDRIEIPFLVTVQEREQIKAWSIVVASRDGQELKSINGNGAPEQRVVWNGLLKDGNALPGGKVYSYQFQGAYTNGKKITSARKLFTVTNNTAFAKAFPDSGFDKASGQLTTTGQAFLQELTDIAKNYKRPSIFISVEAPKDNASAEEINALRARAAQLRDWMSAQAETSGKNIIIKSNVSDKVKRSALKLSVVLSGNESKVELRDQYRRQPSAEINGKPFTVDQYGRFTENYNLGVSQELVIKLTNESDESVIANIPLPEFRIIFPDDEVTVQYGQKTNDLEVLASDYNPNLTAKDIVARQIIRGEASPGTEVKINGLNVSVADDGKFTTPVSLTSGKNVIGIESTRADARKRLINIFIDVTDKEKNGQPIVAANPIPHLSVSMPSTESPITSKDVVVSGTTSPGNKLSINQQEIVVNPSGEFSHQLSLEYGENPLNMVVTDEQGNSGTIEKNIQVVKNKLFMLAFGDGKVGYESIKGQGKSGFYSDGRLAFYLKGHIKGEYLITAALDTERGSFSELFKDLNKQQTREFVANLDKDSYYPVYGDDSSLLNETQSQGKLFLAVSSDEIEAILGNYALNFNNAELTRYQRNFYGLKARYYQMSSEEKGRVDSQVVTFVAQNPTVHITNYLEATGGSLYYLSNRDIVAGSENLQIIVQDQQTGLVLSREKLQREIDYDVQYANGRILLTTPLQQYVESSSLISNYVLQGNKILIQADYNIEGSIMDKTAAGMRVDQKLTDQVTVGASYIDDGSDGQHYQLSGANINIKLKPNTQFALESASSKGATPNILYSDNGGLTYEQRDDDTDKRGDAWKFSTQVDVGEWFNQPDKYSFKAYVLKQEAGFRSSNRLLSFAERHYGVNTDIKLDKTSSAHIGYTVDSIDITEQDQTARTDTGVIKLSKTISAVTASGELRTQTLLDRERDVLSKENTAAAKLSWRVNEKLRIDAKHQQNITGESKQTSSAGTELQLTQTIALNAVAATGTEGQSLQVGAKVKLDESSIYVNRRMTNDTSAETESTILGAESRMSPGRRLYTEYQWRDFSAEKEQASLLGIEQAWAPTEHLRLKTFGEYTDLTRSADEKKRHAGGIKLIMKLPGVDANSQNEVRRERGDTSLIQYLSANRLDLQISEDYKLLTSIRVSRSEALDSGRLMSRFNDQSLGLAYRPMSHTHYNGLLRIARYEDYKENLNDSLSLVGSAEGSYALRHLMGWMKRYSWVQKHQRKLSWLSDVEWVQKVAFKRKRFKGNDNTDLTSDSLMTITHFNYNFYRQFDVGLEYRTLSNSLANDLQRGWLTEVSWRANPYLRVGTGINFSHFSDNILSDNETSSRGLFLRIQGNY
ncbi:MAG: right-handed parallel beta-helix repeat-containing protein [Gammaproteobacteria bacterium]|nr:right-handed parallel beta-helix repeat-containing protein [Gammaproteobacteria bacterium]